MPRSVRSHLRAPLHSTAGLVLAVALLSACAGPPGPLPGPLPGPITLAGKWDTNWGQMVLQETGQAAYSGTFEHRHGTLVGKLDGDLFLFTWKQPRDRESGVLAADGRGYMRVQQNGDKMEGTWGYRDALDGGGVWEAERVIQH